VSNNQITWQGEPLDTKDENDMRFKKCMEAINNLKPGELEQLVGEEFMKEFKRSWMNSTRPVGPQACIGRAKLRLSSWQ
jgi:hypothetical protein